MLDIINDETNRHIQSLDLELKHHEKMLKQITKRDIRLFRENYHHAVPIEKALCILFNVNAKEFSEQIMQYDTFY